MSVALFPWGLVYDDFLDSIGVSLEAFCTQMTGGYLFNYVEALERAGIRAFIVLISARVPRVTRTVHVPTGATILILPPTRLYLALRGLLASPVTQRVLAWLRPVRSVLGELTAYAATPLRTTTRELMREQCAGILSQEYEYSRFDTLVRIGGKLGVPVFATFQGADRPGGLLQRLRRPRSLRRSAGLIIGPRREIARVRDRYALPEAKLAHIFNPIGPETFEGTPRDEARAALDLPGDARIAVWYGRVERHVKGLDVLLEAWERICQERPGMDLRLLMIGTGNDAPWLRKRLQASRMDGVQWQDDYVHDRRILRLHLSAADVYAFPSRHEGFPVAPIEAMACGLPVVAAEAPGVADIVEGGECPVGEVVPCGDVDRFAQALGRFLDDAELCHRIGECARRRALRYFSLEEVGRQMRQFMVERGLPDPGEPSKKAIHG